MSCSQPEFEIAPGVSLELAEHRSTVISNLSYTLQFDVPAEVDRTVEGRIVIAFELADAATDLVLDFRAEPSQIRELTINGAGSEYRHVNEHIIIPAVELAEDRNQIDIAFYAGSDALNRNPGYLYTLFVPDRARTAFPLFDQPDLKATWTLTLGVPAGWQALSNAPVETIDEEGATRVFRFGRSDLISSYLFAFVAGEFELVTRERNGRTMRMLHRETDAASVERNVEAIFDLHARALAWLEDYTGVDFPFRKFDFALIPTMQYGGMEHAGAIFYRAGSLLLDESPSDAELINRARLIGHETAHMWFGNLVTMEWFDDVWMKEVFANFMAAKIVNPSFPDIDHELRFLVDHHPAAYAVDRTAGANPIRQPLDNLDQAGQLYGNIIYDKAPIMMRQLEALIGETRFQEGVREYLQDFAFGNAGWPSLIAIFDALTETDVGAWSEVWVETAGRPEFEVRSERSPEASDDRYLIQNDAAGAERIWPQRFETLAFADGRTGGRADRQALVSAAVATPLAYDSAENVIFNSDGFGYGLFPADAGIFSIWASLGDLDKAAALVNLYENLLAGPAAGQNLAPGPYLDSLRTIVRDEQNQLVLDLALAQLQTIYWNLLPVPERAARAPELESELWQALLEQTESSRKKIYFDALSGIAISPDAVDRVYDIWSGASDIEGLLLSENDQIDIAQGLAIRLPGRADEIIEIQLARTENPDNQRRLRFLIPSLSADVATRDAFFESLADAESRRPEPWVLDALGNLHHPLRIAESEKYLQPSLELLEAIQTTGDIFFPSRWLVVTFNNHRSDAAVATVNDFLEARPDYNEQLRMKILQAADPLFRANAIVNAPSGTDGSPE